ncbi:MAG: hypothetical protein ACK5LC_08485 [Coprobacillaceae bacterium]
MKKRIVITFLLGFLIVGCTTKSKEEIREEKVKEEEMEDEVVIDTSDALSQDEYILHIFELYGYTPPDKNSWIIKHEGDNKVAVIIKENIGNGKPDITKLIFLWNGSSDNAEILFIMINNQILFGDE